MQRYTFRTLAMFGEMYVGEEEAGIDSGTDFHLATDVRELAKRVLPYIQEDDEVGEWSYPA